MYVYIYIYIYIYAESFRMFKPSCRPMFKPPSLGPPYFPSISIVRQGCTDSSKASVLMKSFRMHAQLGARSGVSLCGP